MENSDPSSVLIRLREEDNVAVLLRSVQPGERIEVNGDAIQICEGLSLGHKIALCSIAEGEKILKYGMPVGSATCAIRKGEHVHLQNMQSDYINPEMREESGKDA